MVRTLLVAPEQRGALPTIRDAIEVADPGAVISIAAGEYAEPLTIRQHVVLSAREPGTVTLTSPFPDAPVVFAAGGQVELVGLALRASDAPAVRVRGGRARSSTAR